MGVTGNTTLSTLTTTDLTTADSLVVNTSTTLNGFTNAEEIITTRLKVNGDESVTRTLAVGGATTIMGTTTLKGDTKTKNVNVDGRLTAIEGSFTNIEGELLTMTNIQSKTLNVSGPAEIEGELNVDTLGVGGTTGIYGELNVEKKATFKNGYESNAVSTTTTPDEGASSNEVVTAEWVKGYLQKVISSL